MLTKRNHRRARRSAVISSEFRAEEETGSGTWELRLRNFTTNKKEKEIKCLIQINNYSKVFFYSKDTYRLSQYTTIPIPLYSLTIGIYLNTNRHKYTNIHRLCYFFANI